MRVAAPSVVLFALTFLFTGCSSHADPKLSCTSADRAPVLGASFKLGYGDRATIASEQLSVTFEKVLAESRCPVGVQCVWEGNARIAIRAVRPPAEGAALELNTSGRDEKVATYEGYKVELLDVKPYPEHGRTVEPSSYCIELKVTKTDA